MTKDQVFHRLGHADPSPVQQAAYLAANDILYLSEQQLRVAEEFYAALDKYEFPNRILELVAATDFAHWLNGCK